MKIVDKRDHHTDHNVGYLGESGAVPKWHSHYLKCPQCFSILATESGDCPKQVILCSIYLQPYIIWIDTCLNCGYDKLAYPEKVLVDVVPTGLQGQGTPASRWGWIIQTMKGEYDFYSFNEKLAEFLVESGLKGSPEDIVKQLEGGELDPVTALEALIVIIKEKIERVSRKEGIEGG